MKKIFIIITTLIFSLSLVACGNTVSTTPNINEADSTTGATDSLNHFDATILEVNKNSIIVEPSEDSLESKSADKISFNIKDISKDFEPEIGQIIEIIYAGGIMESYPAQISNVLAINKISESPSTIVTYDLNDKATETTPLPESAIADLDNRQEEWGVILETQNVTPSGLTIVCNQHGGTDSTELTTGSFYTIQKLEDQGFVNVEYLPQEYSVAWTAEAWIINKDTTTSWDVDWGWLYGELPVGEYRIGKEIMNFKGPGDYETEIIYAHFEIK